MKGVITHDSVFKKSISKCGNTDVQCRCFIERRLLPT